MKPKIFTDPFRKSLPNCGLDERKGFMILFLTLGYVTNGVYMISPFGKH